MRRKAVQALDSTKEMTGLVQQACLVAKDAAFNLRDYLENSSNMAFIAVQDCEKELDRAERKIDDGITHAITQVSEVEARELLACLKFIIDLERIGDLAWSVTQRLHRLTPKILRDDRRDLIAMADILEKMLDVVHKGFVEPRSGIGKLDIENRFANRSSLPLGLSPALGKQNQRPQPRLQHQPFADGASLRARRRPH